MYWEMTSDTISDVKNCHLNKLPWRVRIMCSVACCCLCYKHYMKQQTFRCRTVLNITLKQCNAIRGDDKII